MTKKLQIKQIMAIALSIIMIIGVMPMTAFADGTYTFPSGSQSGDNNSLLRYSLTDENAGSITVNQSNNHLALYLNIDDGWYFEKWDTYFNGYEDRAILSDPEVKGSNPVSDDGYYTFYNINQNQPFSNSRTFLYISTSTNFYGDHKVTAVLKPILTINADDGVSYQVTTNSPTTVSSNQIAVKYGDNATITYSIDNKYVVTGVSANYGTNYSDNGAKVTVNSIKKPATVTISTKLKQHNVIFDANGGSGTMSAQVFEHSVAQTLTENNFTKVGYTFAGWNTLANGGGISYSDKQSVTFTPANNGDSITLYAQWTECNNHTWTDGECTDCGTACSHSGGTATCTEKAVCTACGQKYGELVAHTYGDATCEAPATCSECRATTGDALGHKDENTDHTCDRGCDKTDMGIHGDTNLDHICDYGCAVAIGTHAAASEKHTCDYCGNAATTCTDFAEVVKPEALKSAADCTNPAVYYKSCTVCGANSTETFTSGEAKGHIYDEGVVTTKPGCETEGIKTFTCTCGHSYTEPVSTTGHSFTEYTANGDATCTADGTKTAKCANCEATNTATDTGSKKAHTYENGKCTVCEAADPNYVPETSSPQTGDNSNIALWIVLLFISGGAVITLTVCDRKRRTAKH